MAVTRPARAAVDHGRLWSLCVALAVAVLPALFDPGAIERATSLYAAASSPHPFYVPEHAALLYFWAPAVALSACILFLSPGLLIAVALRRARAVSDWILYSLALSLALISLFTTVAQAVTGLPFRGATFGWLVVGLAVVCAAIAAMQDRRGEGLVWPLETHATWTAISMIAVPFAILVALAPKFYWEAFNGDGAHAYESARLLLVQVLPFWPTSAGPVAGFPGITSMLFAYPSSWFIRLFGELEASARLPLLLYLPALFGSIAALARVSRTAEFGRMEQALLWLSIVTYTVSMAFSATYSPYSADVALPATQDTLLVVCFLGFVLAFVHAERAWMLFFLALTYLSLPSGLILVGFWTVAAMLIMRPRPRSQATSVVVGLVALTIAGAVVPSLLAALALPVPGREYGLAGLLRYFAFLQFTDMRRLLYVAIPCGILPIVSLAIVSRQDGVARTLSFVSLAYFVFFFVQANVALHHFVPSMLIPLAVLWRTAGTRTNERPLWLGAALGTGVVALALALPPTRTIYMEERTIGRTIDNKIDGYEQVAPAQIGASVILQELFPPAWSPSVPDASFSDSSIALNYYTHHGASGDASEQSGDRVNYIVQPIQRPPPPGARMVANSETVALFVLDDAVWRAHLALRPASPAGSPWLAVPRSTLFHAVPAVNGPRVIDVAATLERLGVDPKPILERLGINR